jgi:hypothetical protein
LHETLSPFRSERYIARPIEHELITGVSNYLVFDKKEITPKRPGDDEDNEASPWIDIQTGRGLALTSMREGWGSHRPMDYDKEIFSGMAFFSTYVIGCSGPTTYVLAKRPWKNQSESVVYTILTSKDWLNRVAKSVNSYHEAQNAFLEGEGKKALKAIRGEASE